MTVKSAWSRLTAFFSSDDPRTGFADTVAMIVVGNQPFYPFYVWYAAGEPVGPAWLTWLSMPFFALAPWLERRRPVAGRVLLLGAALGNTLLSAVALGPATAVELFYVPCLVLAYVGFEPPLRRRILPAALVAAALGLGFARWVAGPLAALAPAQSKSLSTMHAVSVACLLAVMALMIYRMRPAVTSRSAP